MIFAGRLQPFKTNILTPTVTHILLFCLIPVGIFLLIQGIKFIRKSIGGVVLLDMPMMQTDARFIVPKEGNYAIWQKGKALRKRAVSMHTPDIYHEKTGERLQLQVPFAVMSTNDGSYGRVRVFTFYAPAGQYRYQLSAAPATRDTWLQKLRTNYQADTSKFFIEIKESRPAVFLVFGILIVILSAFCIITGFVFTLQLVAGH